MKEIIEAIFENGVLRPVQPWAGVPEGQHVTISVVAGESRSGLASCIGILPDEDAREMRGIIADTFEGDSRDEWK